MAAAAGARRCVFQHGCLSGSGSHAVVGAWHSAQTGGYSFCVWRDAVGDAGPVGPFANDDCEWPAIARFCGRHFNHRTPTRNRTRSAVHGRLGQLVGGLLSHDLALDASDQPHSGRGA